MTHDKLLAILHDKSAEAFTPWQRDTTALRTYFLSDNTQDWPFCPITAAAYLATGKAYHIHFWREAAAAMGMPRHEAQRIVRAADGDVTSAPRVLRQALLHACGLVELPMIPSL